MRAVRTIGGIPARLNRLARWQSGSMRILGAVETVLGLLLTAMAVATAASGGDASVFLIPAPFLLVPGILQYTLFAGGRDISVAVSILTVMTAWSIAFAAMAAPFLLHGCTWYDALFESVSGLTTTGFSVFADVESLPAALLFWRSLSQWVGGLAVVIVFMFLLPMLGIGGRALINNELSGAEAGNFAAKLREVAVNFIAIYLALSAIQMLLLAILGVPVFEAVCIGMSCISTGGMSVLNDSLASHTFAVQAVVVVFMFLGGTNFYLHYRFLYKRDYKAYIRCQELVWTVIWFAVATVLILLALASAGGGGLGDDLWSSLFAVVSFGTSTGFSAQDHSAWPAATLPVLMLLGLFGAMSGSTAGGIKIYRLVIVKEYIAYGLHRMIHPRAVRDVRLDGHSVGTDALIAALTVMLSFLAAAAVGTVLFMWTEPGTGLADAAGLCIASLGNVGAGIGVLGDGVPVADLSLPTKAVMAALMWIGRLEVTMFLLLFTRVFWSDVRRHAAASHRRPGRRTAAVIPGRRR